MAFSFYKYQGTGNDFVLIDNRQQSFSKNNTKLIAHLCDRKFGIGADGLILLEAHEKLDFRMVYYNADGAESSFCGNGSRCITHFAKFLGIIDTVAKFEATDGLHSSEIHGQEISVKMRDVGKVRQIENYLFLNTGSPHHVELVTDLTNFDLVGVGRKIRNEVYGKEGANINFVEALGESRFAVRTYERGVEDETLSCGTGVTAVAIAMAHKGFANFEEVLIKTMGGDLKVTFRRDGEGFRDVYLIGPAVQVFKGEWK
jgi:diaminopimelate epimerase